MLSRFITILAYDIFGQLAKKGICSCVDLVNYLNYFTEIRIRGRIISAYLVEHQNSLISVSSLNAFDSTMCSPIYPNDQFLVRAFRLFALSL